MFFIFSNRHKFQEGELLRVQSELTRLIATRETSARKRQEIMEEVEKMSERKKCDESVIATLERNLSTLREDNVKLKSMFELSEREKKLLEKNLVKVNGEHDLTAIVF